jgi:hypothetical protein
MKRVKIGLLSIAMLFATSAFAQESEKKDSVQAPESIQTLKLASELTLYGYKNNAVLPLIQAADLYLSVNTKELKAEAREKGEGKETSKKEKVSFDVNKILADAKELATLEADETLYLTLIANLEKKAKDQTRSPINGVSKTYERVQAHAKDTYTVRFNAYQYSYIEVYGDGDTDLDLFVYDNNGNLLASDTRAAYNASVWIYANCTCPFKVVVKNNGNVHNNYMLYMY